MPSDYQSSISSNGTLKDYAITDSDKVRQEGDALDWDYRVLKASTFDINEKIIAPAIIIHSLFFFIYYSLFFS